MDLVIGLMSGTSADGIDAALVRTNGEQLQRIHAAAFPYRESTRESVFAAYKNPGQLLANQRASQALSQAIAQDHASAVIELIEQSKLISDQAERFEPQEVKLLGFHGQTVLHQPEQGVSIQLGDAVELAALTNIDTVHNFRIADIGNGGQGAPLAPVYHECLMRQASAALPAVFLNVGGVANLTYLGVDTLLGFDTGPGNGLLDQYMQQHFNQSYDADGQLAAQGRIEQSLVDGFLKRDYFTKSNPKSLDRADFNDVLQSKELASLNAADAMATLLAMTVQSVKLSIESLDAYPRQVVVCGGGQHNHTLLKQLDAVLGCTVEQADNIGIPGDYIEAELMAFLAARRVRHLPATYPSTTGANVPTVAGDVQLVSPP